MSASSTGSESSAESASTSTVYASTVLARSKSPARLKSQPVNIAPSTAKPSLTLDARNMTKPRHTARSVYTRESTRPAAVLRQRSTSSTFRLSSAESSACHAPQSTKVMLAPCQSPHSTNTTALFAAVRHLPRREPPSGMYR